MSFAVVYVVKSTEDKHGSVPTQLADCRALAEPIAPKMLWVRFARQDRMLVSTMGRNRAIESSTSG